MASRARLDPDFLAFLADLARHNDRAWFNAHKARYEASVRDPFLALIADLAAPLRKLTPPFVADPRPVGGSALRIYRDTRFARDKTPYKTAMAAHFWPASGRGEACPALYLRLEPGKSGFGGGLWRPEPAVAGRVRSAIAGDTARWRRAVEQGDFRSTFERTGESLKRLPPGFDPASPVAADLKRKDFIFTSGLADRQVTAADLREQLVARWKSAMPFMRFLLDSVGAGR